MHDDYDIPNDASELSDQERVEQDFIGQYLSLEEIESIAIACERVEDVILAQYYFACVKRDVDVENLRLLAEIVEDKLKIMGVRLGIPELGYFS